MCCWAINYKQTRYILIMLDIFLKAVCMVVLVAVTRQGLSERLRLFAISHIT